MTLRRLNCRRLQVCFPKPRTAEEREYMLNWQADNLPGYLEDQADSRDDDRDSDAELGGRQ